MDEFPIAAIRRPIVETMKIVVTGGRDYAMTAGDYRFLATVVQLLRPTQFLTNGRPGVPAQAEAWARQHGIPVQRIEADWVAARKAPETRRNTTLANLADAVVAFPGGTGTADMIAKARQKKLPVHESPSRQLANLPALRLPPRIAVSRSSPRMSP